MWESSHTEVALGLGILKVADREFGQAVDLHTGALEPTLTSALEKLDRFIREAFRIEEVDEAPRRDERLLFWLTRGRKRQVSRGMKDRDLELP